MGEMLGVTDLADYLCSINEQCGFMEQSKQWQIRLTTINFTSGLNRL